MSESNSIPVNNWFFRIRTSLRARVAFGVGLPVLLALSLLSVTHYLREQKLLEDQIELTSSQMGSLVLGGLQHAMLVNDQADLEKVIQDIGAMETVDRILIVNLDGEVKSDSSASEIGKTYQSQSLGCVECHQNEVDSRPLTSRLATTESTLRISTPITNDESCWGCHASSSAHLGMVILDVSLIDTEAHVLEDLRTDLVISVISTLVITVAVYLLIHWLVVRRVEAFQGPLAQFATGDHSARLPSGTSPTDELGQLAKTFNRMAEEFQQQEQEKAVRAEVKQRAIREERERIARELHDGMAQLLGYVNMKVMAVRLMLTKERYSKAQQQLMQIEEASQELFVDVREAILGLRMNGGNDLGLANTIQEYSDRFSKLSEIKVDVKVDPEAEGIRFDAETELQLLRIVQEALTNIRKHASAENVWVKLEIEQENLALTVGDDGIGFDPNKDINSNQPHFGLGTMQERAESIGAEFTIISEPGSGTRIEILINRNGT